MCVFLPQSRLSNSPVVEQLINTTDEAVVIKVSNKDKDHTGYLEMEDKCRIDGAAERPMRLISLEMIINLLVDIQIGVNAV